MNTLELRLMALRAKANFDQMPTIQKVGVISIPLVVLCIFGFKVITPATKSGSRLTVTASEVKLIGYTEPKSFDSKTSPIPASVTWEMGQILKQGPYDINSLNRSDAIAPICRNYGTVDRVDGLGLNIFCPVEHKFSFGGVNFELIKQTTAKRQITMPDGSVHNPGIPSQATILVMPGKENIFPNLVLNTIVGLIPYSEAGHGSLLQMYLTSFGGKVAGSEAFSKKCAVMFQPSNATETGARYPSGNPVISDAMGMYQFISPTVVNTIKALGFESALSLGLLSPCGPDFANFFNPDGTVNDIVGLRAAFGSVISKNVNKMEAGEANTLMSHFRFDPHNQSIFALILLINKISNISGDSGSFPRLLSEMRKLSPKFEMDPTKPLTSEQMKLIERFASQIIIDYGLGAEWTSLEGGSEPNAQTARAGANTSKAAVMTYNSMAEFKIFQTISK
jgi:hypothetical protein